MPYKDPKKRRAAQRVYQKDYYERNRQAFLDANAQRRTDRRAFLDRLKSKPCADCGRTYPPYVMDFDHRDPEKKVRNISNMAHRGLSEARILEEIAECDLVCANCHRIRTFGPRRTAA